MGKESIELRNIRQDTHIKSAHFAKSRMRIEEADKSGDRFYLFEIFYDKSSDHRMAGISGAADAEIFV